MLNSRRLFNALASFVMESGSLAFFFIGSLLIICRSTEAARSAPPLCVKRSLFDIAALQRELCYPHMYQDDCTSRVLQVGVRDANKDLSLYMKGNPEYIALLFHAEWCPFSRSLRQMFDLLSIHFPGIHHIAVESSALWPSELSEHGVRSFPALFVQNKSLRLQFHGPHTMESLSRFYVDKTGFLPVSLSYSLNVWNTLPTRHADSEKTWRHWFAKWLRNDFYLVFSVLFLLLRSFMHVRPKVLAGLRQYWNLKGMSSKAQRRIPSPVNTQQRKQVARVAGKLKGTHSRKEDKESGKGVLSVPSWPSSSLAAVALAECSSRGVASTEDVAKKSVCGA